MGKTTHQIGAKRPTGESTQGEMTRAKRLMDETLPE